MEAKKSNCCNARIYIAPKYYTYPMANDIPRVEVCTKCGHEININVNYERFIGKSKGLVYPNRPTMG